MPDRWSAEQVRSLAPDASSQRAASKLAVPGPWSESGATVGAPALVWGLCRGSGSAPYQVGVGLTGPAYRCSCPSRKFPCKHALALLLRWADGQVPAAEPPDWVVAWQQARSARQAGRAPDRPEEPADPAAAARRAAQRADRVAAGLAELDRWLTDQARQGLAGATATSYRDVDAMAARLVDAQAPAAAGAVRRLGALVGTGTDRAGRLLAELSLLHLLTRAYRRIDTLPAELAATVRARVGLPVGRPEVLAGPPVADRWFVLGHRDEIEDKLTVRRCWLRGTATGRPALVLSFAAPAQPLPADLVTDTVLDGELHFYPGAAPLRALVGAVRTGPEGGAPPAGDDIPTALAGYAAALAAEPWLDRWPMLLAGVTITRQDDRWLLAASDGTGLPLHPDLGAPWRQVAVGGGQPVTVAAEWTPAGLWPLTVFTAEGIAA